MFYRTLISMNFRMKIVQFDSVFIIFSSIWLALIFIESLLADKYFCSKFNSVLAISQIHISNKNIDINCVINQNSWVSQDTNSCILMNVCWNKIRWSIFSLHWPFFLSLFNTKKRLIKSFRYSFCELYTSIGLTWARAQSQRKKLTTTSSLQFQRSFLIIFAEFFFSVSSYLVLISS